MKKKLISITIFSIIIIFLFSTILFASNITGVSVEKNYIFLEIGQTEKIIVNFTPANVVNKEIIWSSSNSNIATVNASGEVKGISSGLTIIKGTTKSGGYTVNITVNVSGESSIKTEKYVVTKKENSLKEEINYIMKVAPKTTISEFKNNIVTYSNMEFYNLANEKMKDAEFVFSGTRLRLADGSEYTLIVTGDVNSNGTITVADLSRLKIKLVGLSTLDDYQMEAADLNFDGKVGITDLSNLKLYLVGLKNTF